MGSLAVLHTFRIIRPRFSGSQERSLDWLPAAHAQADRTSKTCEPSSRIEKAFRRVGCPPSQIAWRGHELDDFNHNDWSRARIYRLSEQAAGLGTEARTQAYAEAAQSVIDRLYDNEVNAPDDLIHVTCTGYLSPSPAQRMVVKKGWSNRTQVTHAYHMGCYGAFPAIRVARGFLAADPTKSRVDLVHTEICCLHIDPSNHSLENIVAQTLFADGFVRYSMSRSHQEGLKIHALREELVPGTEDAMTWSCGDHGMKMTLSKDVPTLIAGAIPRFFGQLASEAGLTASELASEARFAVHPGGPKIVDCVQETLGLRDMQLAASRHILRECGNMSSATVPHIWAHILADIAVPAGAWVVSFAFGPGLTLCGSVLRKTGP